MAIEEWIRSGLIRDHEQIVVKHRIVIEPVEQYHYYQLPEPHDGQQDQYPRAYLGSITRVGSEPDHVSWQLELNRGHTHEITCDTREEAESLMYDMFRLSHCHFVRKGERRR